MLSRTERDYLSGKIDISQSHKRVLKYKIKNKLRDFYMLELPLIQQSGITEFNNIITENNNAEANSTYIMKGEEGIRTPIDSLCRRTHSRSATSPHSKKISMNN